MGVHKIHGIWGAQMSSAKETGITPAVMTQSNLQEPG